MSASWGTGGRNLSVTNGKKYIIMIYFQSLHCVHSVPTGCTVLSSYPTNYVSSSDYRSYTALFVEATSNSIGLSLGNSGGENYPIEYCEVE